MVSTESILFWAGGQGHRHWSCLEPMRGRPGRPTQGPLQKLVAPFAVWSHVRFHVFTFSGAHLESFQSLLPFRLCPKSTMSLQLLPCISETNTFQAVGLAVAETELETWTCEAIVDVGERYTAMLPKREHLGIEKLEIEMRKKEIDPPIPLFWGSLLDSCGRSGHVPWQQGDKGDNSTEQIWNSFYDCRTRCPSYFRD